MATPQLEVVSDLDAALQPGSSFDAVVVVSKDATAVPWPTVQEVAKAAAAVDSAHRSGVTFLPAAGLPGGRLVLAPTGGLDRDQDDVRCIGDAAKLGVARARDAGAKAPLLLLHGVPSHPDYEQALPVALLGSMQGLWQPLEGREAKGEDAMEPVQRIGFGDHDGGGRDLEAIRNLVQSVESGRRLARDLGGTEPERMSPPNFADYCQAAFEGTDVAVEILDDQEAILRDYPLLSAVARCSQMVERHQPRVVRLEWSGAGPVERTLLIAGKGLTYDTGGADIKAGGAMAGMSRDKGGGAAAAGFVRAIAALKPAGVRVIAEIGAVRNSVGADSFVSDEIIHSHAGVRVRIGNTDAEGRLVLADLLSHLRERAKGETHPQLLSIATLTGHAARAVGGYTASLDNGPARAAGVSETYSKVGDLWGDPFDVQRLRREDYSFVAPRTSADDVLSCNNAASVNTARGHQFPMAFLAIASGLDQHGRHSDQPLPYTHIDVAGSATEGSDWQHGRPTAAPVLTLVGSLLG